MAKKPVFVKIGPQLGLGYRRNHTAGTWVARVADGAGANWTKAIGNADDFEDASGGAVLDFWQAQEKVRALARDSREGAKPVTVEAITVAKAIDRYEADLKTRGGDAGNAARVRTHLTPALARQTVAALTARDLRTWRDAIATKLKPASVNRTTTGLKAAFNLAADQDERITTRRPWEIGLATILGAEESRNVILPDARVRELVAAATVQSREFGLLIEVAAVTGARISQLARLEIQDLQADRPDPRLMMPVSRKGKGAKAVLRRPVPIPAGLAAKLATDRADTAPLLLKPSGEPWRKSDHSRLFTRAVRRVGLDPDEVTLYALRHSSVVRQVLAGVPVRVVAVNHDTSVAMLERTYSRFIGDHADALARGALLDMAATV
ncbi:MAG TPA: tyrosine-type recombinase/integrase [Stellaceae bacterium]|nr:tyrosine-type recombinase/integrase [Stellaceae bacterium]